MFRSLLPVLVALIAVRLGPPDLSAQETTPIAPQIVTAPVASSEMIGGAVSFVVTANGSAPLRYQWYHVGAAIAGATDAILTISPIAATDAGLYTVEVGNSLGLASAECSLATPPQPPSPVDPTFHADPSLEGAPSPLLPLPDGGLLVAHAVPRRIARLKADGSLDSTWVSGSFATTDETPPEINVMVRQADGRFLVGGWFATYNGAPALCLVRLNTDGRLDTSFVPTPTLTRPVIALAVQPDGKVLVGDGGTTVLRLLDSGQIDPTFKAQALEPAQTPYIGTKRDWSIRDVAVDSIGRIIIGAQANITFTAGFPTIKVTIARLTSDGTLDGSFRRFESDGRFTRMRVLSDDGVAIADGNSWSEWFVQVHRLNSDGALLPGYLAPQIGAVSAIAFGKDGSFVYSGGGRTQYDDSTGLADASAASSIGAINALVIAPTGVAYAAGPFTVYDTVAANRLVRLNRIPNEALHAPEILAVTADRAVVAPGDTVSVKAAVTGSGPMTYEWARWPGTLGPAVVTTVPNLRFVIDSSSVDQWVRLTARNSRGDAVSSEVHFTLMPGLPVITAQPTHVSAQSGRNVALHVTAQASATTLTSQWTKNGQPIVLSEPVPDPYTLYLTNVSAATAGSYAVTFTNTAGQSVTSAPILVTIDDSSRFVNLSSRGGVGDGDKSLIAGFVVTGVQSRTVVIRGVGPSLTQYGVTNPLPDPQLTVYDAGGRSVFGYALLDNWDANSDGGAYQKELYMGLGAFALDAGSKDAAGIVTLPPGQYTIQLSGKPGQSGVALLEIYEADQVADRILNLSSRGFVAADAPAINGLAIRGAVPKRVLVRSVGPSLTRFGVTNPLPNPRLAIKDSAGRTVASNDDWESPDAVAIAAASASVGAFPLQSASTDAAVVTTLPPGNYSIITDDAANGSGIVLVEVYELP